MRTLASSTRSHPIGYRPFLYVSFVVVFFAELIDVHINTCCWRARVAMKTCEQLPLCNVLSIQTNRRELVKSRCRFWSRTYITKAVNISIDRTMWMSDICILNDWSVKYKDIFITITSRTKTQRTLHSLRLWLFLFLAQNFLNISINIINASSSPSSSSLLFSNGIPLFPPQVGILYAWSHQLPIFQHCKCRQV